MLDAWVPGGRNAVGAGGGGGSSHTAGAGEHKRSASGPGRRSRRARPQGRGKSSNRIHSSRSLDEGQRHGGGGGGGKHGAEGGKTTTAAAVSGDLLTRAMAAGAEAIGVEERDLRHALQLRAREVASSMLQEVGITDDVMEGAGAYLDEVSGDAARGPVAQARETARQSVFGVVSAIVAAVFGSGCLIALNLVRTCAPSRVTRPLSLSHPLAPQASFSALSSAGWGTVQGLILVAGINAGVALLCCCCARAQVPVRVVYRAGRH